MKIVPNFDLWFFFLQKTRLQTAANLYERKYRSLKRTFMEIKDVLVEKELIIRRLENPAATHDESKNYIAYQDVMGEQNLKHLRSIDTNSGSDAKFIRLSIEFIYNGDTSIHRVMTCRAPNNGADCSTKIMSPNKKRNLKNIFNERIDLTNTSEQEKIKRKQLFTTLCSKALFYLRSKAGKEQTNQTAQISPTSSTTRKRILDGEMADQKRRKIAATKVNTISIELEN